jgi:transposase
MVEQDTIGATGVPMIEPEVVAQIKTLSDLGWGTRAIARELGIDRKSVRRYREGIVVEQTRPRARCLDEDGVAAARELFAEVAGGNAVVVRDLLQERGYGVGERTVQRVVSSTRRELRAAQLASVRYETAPAAQMQIDFGEKRVVIDGREIVVHLMAAVLAYSRRIFVKAFLAERAEDWREGIAEAFRHFGGVTHTILVDNARALVKSRDAATKTIVFHPGLLALCRDFDCAPRACAPYRARTKGKVESGVKYVKRNALAGRRFASFAELEAHLSSWMTKADERVHGTTNDVPRERFERDEKAALRALPSARIVARGRRLQRRVSNDAFVDVDTVRYSVPHRLVRAKLDVEVGESRVRIYDGAQIVADHARSNEPHDRVVDKTHHAGLWRPTSAHVEERLGALGRSLNDYAAAVGGDQ